MTEFRQLRDDELDAAGAVRIAQAVLDTADLDDPLQMARAEEGLHAARRALARIQRRILAVEAAAAEADLEQTDDQAQVPAETPAELRSLAYETVEDWVNGYLVSFWRRPSGRWCRRWWEHAEALGRLEGLWRSWEHFRWEGGPAMLGYYRDYLDPMMRELTAPDGTFAKCTWQTETHELCPPVQLDRMPLKIRQILRQTEGINQ